MLKFYKCPVCGNIAIKLTDGKAPMYCCGKQMEEIKPNSTDGAGEKHVPVITEETCGGARCAKVQVGSELHPMMPAHHIEWIILETNMGYSVVHLRSSDAPVAKFCLMEDEKVTCAYEFCNQHGIWQS